MRRLLCIFSFILVVYGEAPADSGYSYPIPQNYASSADEYSGGYSEENSAEEINKFIYFFKSPADQKKPAPPKPHVKPPPPKKNYKIIFIKAPEAPAPPAPPQVLPPRNDEKTIVYVLSKKPEEQPEVILPTPPSTKPPAPEVYFINYGINKENGAVEAGGYNYSSQSETAEAPASKPLIIPSEYLPPQGSSPENKPQAPVIESHEAKPKPPSPVERYESPSTAYSSFEGSTETSSNEASVDSSGQVGPTRYVIPLEKQNEDKPPVPKLQPSFASEIASQYGPPTSNISPPRAEQVYLPPKSNYGVPDRAISLISKESSSASFESSSRYLPPKTSYGVPIPNGRQSRASRYSPTRRTRRVYHEYSPSLDIVKGIYEYYGP
nr:extensin-like [Leptinotarsa decemlineata]